MINRPSFPFWTHCRVIAISGVLLAIFASPASATIIIQETWTGTNGSAWPTQWSFVDAAIPFTKDILSNEGRLQKNQAGNDDMIAYINATTLADFEQTVTFRFAPNTTGAAAGLVARMPDGDWDTYYYLRLQNNSLATDTMRIFQVVNNTEVQLGGTFTLSANLGLTTNQIRFVVSGSGSTTELSAKVWLAGDPEPGAFQLSVTDFITPLVLQGTGRFGLYSRNAGNLRTTFFDNYEVEVATIPEPSALILAGVGAGVILLRHRLFRRS